MIRVVVLSILLGLATSPSHSFAQTAPSSAPATPASADGSGEAQGEGEMRFTALSDSAARSHFRVGQTLYSEGRFREAGAEFEQAYFLSNRPALLYNAYVAYRDANDLEKAIVVLEEFLRVSPPSEDTAVLERRLEAMRATHASQRSDQTTAEEERARLAAERERFEREAAEARARAERAEREVARRSSPVPFIVGGAGVALLAGAGVAAIIANGNVSDAEATCPARVCPNDVDLDGIRASVRRPAITTDVLLGAGTVTLVTGVVLLVVSRSGRRAEPAPVQASCDGTGCRGSVSLRF